MQLTKLSATAMEVAEVCMSRHLANTRAGSGGEQKGYPAKVGSTVHGALEMFVKAAVMNSSAAYEMKSLEIFLMKAFVDEWGHLDQDSTEWKDCLELCKTWFARTSFENKIVLSCEEKFNFTVPTSQGDVPFNFIIDRLDIRETEPGTYEVIDYKSLRAPLSPEELFNKLQARIYALAIAIKYKNSDNPPQRIWVKFDMLRHDKVVGVVFTREDLAKTWKRIIAACERILATSEETAAKMEVLNDGCGFCIKKTTCNAVAANKRAGGVHSYDTLQEQIDARALLKLQYAALGAALKEFDPVIKAAIEGTGKTSVESELTVARLAVKSERQIDAYELENVIGNTLFRKYGSHAITMKSVDELLKDPFIDEATKARVESLITKQVVSTYVDTKGKKK